MEETVNLREIFNILKKRLVLIISIALLALILSTIMTFFIITPTYQASTQILVNQSQSEQQTLTSQELQSNRELIGTYNIIITSPVILESVIQETNYSGTIDDLRSQIEVSEEEDSQVATLTVETNSMQSAVSLANAIAQTFEEKIPNIMNVDNVSILSEAQMTDGASPVSPKPLLNLAVALVVGLIVGTIVAFLLEFLDKSIKTEHDVEKEIGLPVLGMVPFMSELDNKPFNESSKRFRDKNKQQKIY